MVRYCVGVGAGRDSSAAERAAGLRIDVDICLPSPVSPAIALGVHVRRSILRPSCSQSAVGVGNSGYCVSGVRVSGIVQSVAHLEWTSQREKEILFSKELRVAHA